MRHSSCNDKVRAAGASQSTWEVAADDGLVENKHLCQDIANRLGLPAARSLVLNLPEISYIVLERFDRLPAVPGSTFVRRVHQEDMCQALGLLPGAKYQQDGGPGITDIVALIRRTRANGPYKTGWIVAPSIPWPQS